MGFQKILTLTYVDKFIDDVQLHFRDRYKNELEQKGAMKLLNHSYEFEDDFNMLLRYRHRHTKRGLDEHKGAGSHCYVFF